MFAMCMICKMCNVYDLDIQATAFIQNLQLQLQSMFENL